MDSMEYLKSLAELNQVVQEFFRIKGDLFADAIKRMCHCLKEGNKILVFGNGGSAAQAQHFASELVNKFYIDRPAIAAVALTTDTSSLTSIANDTSYDFVFSRQVEALGRRGDVALALSTSGNSPNIIKVLEVSREFGLMTVALTGQGGGKLASLPDFLLDVPSTLTPRIQEAHLILLHHVAQEIESTLS
jgi:D-sedoheptulose 7-phosphate isomerase